MAVRTIPFKLDTDQTVALSQAVTWHLVPRSVFVFYGLFVVPLAIVAAVLAGAWWLVVLAAVPAAMHFGIGLIVRSPLGRNIREHNARTRIAEFRDDDFEFASEGGRINRWQSSDVKKLDVLGQCLVFRPKVGQPFMLPNAAFQSEDDLQWVIDRFRACGVKVTDRRRTRR